MKSQLRELCNSLATLYQFPSNTYVLFPTRVNYGSILEGCFKLKFVNFENYSIKDSFSDIHLDTYEYFGYEKKNLFISLVRNKI